jgi:acetylornithine deacetylase/succinyl-diaminopimelate desuccinylase-like protein
MKTMVALEVGVLRLLAARARAAGLDPATDPVPGLRRDVLFASTADEEAGGWHGAGWLVDHRPETLRAAGALNEAGGIPIQLGGRRFYAIQVAEKGYEVFRIHVHGTWGHGSMPRDDNAVVLAAEAISRLATPGEPRVTPVLRRLLDELAAALPPEQARLVEAMVDDDPRRADVAVRAVCDPVYAGAMRALLRDTISPTIVHAGVKYNVIPGEAVFEVDVRKLPGTTEGDVREEIQARLGDLAERCTIEHVIGAVPVEAPAEGELYEALAAAIRAHDPDGIPVPVIAPFATDAKHTLRLGVPTYGFSPLGLGPDERFLDRFHAVDERISLGALRWGLPVLYDAVVGYCG